MAKKVPKTPNERLSEKSAKSQKCHRQTELVVIMIEIRVLDCGLRKEDWNLVIENFFLLRL